MDIITTTELQERFNVTIQNNSHRNLKIENEIKAVEEYVYNIPVLRSPFKKQPLKTSINKIPQVFNLGNTYIDRNIFHDAFCKYLNSEETTIIEQYQNDSQESHRLKQRSANQAIELFKYYEWLKTQLSTPQKIEKKSEGLSHKEKMLALYYLGLDMRKFRNNLQSAKILSKILDLDESNTKENLTYFDGINCKVKTEANLKKVLELFEHKDFKEIHTVITREIEK